MSKKKVVVICSALLILVLVIVGFQYLPHSISAKALTEAEAKQVALNKYPGEILEIKNVKGEFRVEMLLETGVYQIKIDEQNGDVVSIEREEKTEIVKEPQRKMLSEDEVEKLVASYGDLQSLEYVEKKDTSHYLAVVTKKNETTTVKVEPYTGEILNTDIEKEVTRVISEAEAITLAQQHVNGMADDVDYVEPADPTITPYFLIEVEVSNEKEGVVQVDAITGQIRSVTWEAADEGDDDNSE
ncbi:putative membrane protein YkoI [Metabacillus crassostreae]|uniref:PepSY domain-containing protein n=1 Tax=Metabacillus crassostreae TaxID=929098 RepID=UPI001958C343|nr:PepSY domain-containing protein [Metabacillus crassostreae]MBM7606326.1 putative membrane protein YkoI [Metabacillus crassostreae]